MKRLIGTHHTQRMVKIFRCCPDSLSSPKKYSEGGSYEKPHKKTTEEKIMNTFNIFSFATLRFSFSTVHSSLFSSHTSSINISFILIVIYIQEKNIAFSTVAFVVLLQKQTVSIFSSPTTTTIITHSEKLSFSASYQGCFSTHIHYEDIIISYEFSQENSLHTFKKHTFLKKHMHILKYKTTLLPKHFLPPTKKFSKQGKKTQKIILLFLFIEKTKKEVIDQTFYLVPLIRLVLTILNVW
ncbi:MAG: hypothetical protein N2314_05780 [Brevinematales bacterium]|nr:hypothetical protein [Brevinematales bacterium]